MKHEDVFFLSFKLKILTHSSRLFIFSFISKQMNTLTKKPLAFILDTSRCDIVPRRWILTVRGGELVVGMLSVLFQSRVLGFGQLKHSWIKPQTG